PLTRAAVEGDRRRYCWSGKPRLTEEHPAIANASSSSRRRSSLLTSESLAPVNLSQAVTYPGRGPPVKTLTTIRSELLVSTDQQLSTASSRCGDSTTAIASAEWRTGDRGRCRRGLNAGTSSPPTSLRLHLPRIPARTSLSRSRIQRRI